MSGLTRRASVSYWLWSREKLDLKTVLITLWVVKLALSWWQTKNSLILVDAAVAIFLIFVLLFHMY